MKNHTLSKVLLVLALAVGLLRPAHSLGATFTLTAGTLASAVTSTSSQVIAVSAVTGFTANTTGIYVDGEFMLVTGVNGASNIRVMRGYGGTKAALHVSGAPFYVGTLSLFQNFTQDPGSACTAATTYVLPWINILTGDVEDCRSSGQWFLIRHGSGSGAGDTISGFCTGTVGSAETEYLNGAACSGATTATARVVMSKYGTVASLRVFSSAGVVGGSSKDVLTVYKNGSATTLTCTFATGGAAVQCSDSTHSFAVAPADVITFQFVTATSDTAANVAASAVLY